VQRWEDVREQLFTGREAAIGAAEDQQRSAVREQARVDERDLAAWDREAGD
jgi:hypothetical protein